MGSYLDSEELAQAGRAIDFLGRHESILRTALGVYAERMEEAAEEAQAGYDAVKDDPERRAAQDKTLMTTNGLKHSAAMFRESADSARAAMRALDEWEYGPDEENTEEVPSGV